MGSTFLQIFLLINVFFIGALAATALRHAYAHFRPHPAETEKSHAQSSQGAHLPAAMREHILETAGTHFQAVLERSVADLQHDLTATTDQLNKLLEKLATEVVSDEMERYRADIDQLRKQAQASIGGAMSEITTYQTAIKAQMDSEMAAEKQRLLQQIDTKLADAVASFLNETLGHNVDLGAQSAYLTEMLEAHKADFTQHVQEDDHETRTA